jgi:hypothetical protein
MNWIDINKQLPGIDEFVLFWTESGNAFVSHIDKDMIGEALDKFLNGSWLSGKITHWSKIKGPE